MLFPKRRQITIALSFLAVVFLIAFSILISKSSSETCFLKKIILESASPMEGGINSTFSCVGRTWKKYIFLVNLEKENRELKEKILAMSQEINGYRETYLECMRLRKLMEFKERTGFTTVAAKVTNRERSSVSKTVIINKGSSDGIEVNFPVVTAEGVVGKVIETSWNVSRILLITDYNSNIDVIVQNSRAHGILQGLGNAGCSLKYIPQLEEMNVGDTVISSGLADIFPSGIPVGTVTGVSREDTDLFQNIRVSPTVDIAKLEEVLVVLKKKETD